MSIKVLYLEKPKTKINIDVVEKELKEFENFFKFCFGCNLKSIQRNYAKRFFANISFSIVAPTGTGKTILGLFLAFYNSFIKNRKSLLIFPTSLLVKQAFDIFSKYSDRISQYRNSQILANEYIFFLSYDNKSIKDEKLFRLSQQDYKLVCLTNQSFSRRFELIDGFKFDYIFVDDLDSVSKGSRSTIRILKLLGFDDEIIQLAKSNGFEVTKDLKQQIDRFVDIGVLVVSSATLRRGMNSILFRKLLNFDIGNSINFVRNIDDVFVGKKDIDRLKWLLDKLGPGAIIFVPSQEEAIFLQNEIPNSKFINSKNIDKIDHLVDFYEDEIDLNNEEFENEEDLQNQDLQIEDLEDEEFNKGINFLIGISSPYSILVRGLDLPYKVRYVVFWGLPKRKINLKQLDQYRNTFFIQKFLSNLFFKRNMVSMQRIRDYIENLNQPCVLSTFVIKDDILYSIDVKTYLQASGRCSRITPNGITKGLSFIFDDEIFFDPFSKVAYFNNFEVMEFEKFNLDKAKEEVDLSRKKNNHINESLDNSDSLDFKTYLMVVESPTKSRQISQMFGNPALTKIGNLQAFEVLSPIGILIIIPSLGHVVELSVDKEDKINLHSDNLHSENLKDLKDLKNLKNYKNLYNVLVEKGLDGEFEVLALYTSIKKCNDCNKTFASTSNGCIYCSSSNLYSSIDNLSSLKTLAFFCDGIIVATDPDAEGEKISFDIINLVNGFSNDYKRVIFNEITKKAIVKALSNPIQIRQNLVNAQLVRRIEDRWIGFTLTNIVKEKVDDYNISAGRVQTPVLHWIVERYKQYNQKKSFSIIEELGLQFPDSDIKGEAQLEIELIDSFEQKVNILPFNTSDFLVFANSVLKLNSVEAMKVLQQLFENGLITYHRTDSYYISDYGISLAKEILIKKGIEFRYRNFGEPHAHEAIRITKPFDPEDVKIMYSDKLSLAAFRVYEMIYRKFLACFTDENYVKIEKYRFILKQSSKIAQIEQERIVETKGKAFEIFPYLAYRKQQFSPGLYTVSVKKIKKPSINLLSQADVIKMMKERDIGRPSTYSSTIQKLFSRGYIIEKFNKLIPTKKGILIDQILNKNYTNFIDEQRTVDLLKKIDEIEQNKRDPIEVVSELLEEISQVV